MKTLKLLMILNGKVAIFVDQNCRRNRNSAVRE